MKFHVITLFPDLIQTYCSTSIIGRGVKTGQIQVLTHNPRDFCHDKYRKVDDTPYGGGAGMVLKPEPIFAAVESIERAAQSAVLLMSPQGVPFNQRLVEEFSLLEEIVILCGHYEGFDERIRGLATHEVSLGDFVLTGGELPALAVIDAVARQVPGVLGKSISLAEESFTHGLLEGPQYTKPVEFRGMIVPEVLRSGNHKAVHDWRRREALRRTVLRRPDLIENAVLSLDERNFVDDLKENLNDDKL